MITSDNTEDASLMRNTTSNTHTHTHTNTHVHAHAHTHIQGYQSAGLKQFEAEGVSVDRIELGNELFDTYQGGYECNHEPCMQPHRCSVQPKNDVVHTLCCFVKKKRSKGIHPLEKSNPADLSVLVIYWCSLVSVFSSHFCTFFALSLARVLFFSLALFIFTRAHAHTHAHSRHLGSAAPSFLLSCWQLAT